MIMEIISFPSLIGASMDHYEVDSWRWQPGMLALPVHDAPWWYTEDDKPAAYAIPGRKVTPV